MTPIKVLLSLITKENDYQRAQAASAEDVARRLGLALEIIYAGNDAVNQTQQILTAIQKKDHGIDVVITQPAGTGMVNVAEAAIKAGVGWGILSREVDYIQRLRLQSPVPVFEVCVDQLEIGRIQARQVAAVLPGGGQVLYISGPASGSSARLRQDGFTSTKPANIEAKTLKANWTEESGYNAVHSWLKLSTSKSIGFLAVVSQNDAMAMGARRAFNEISNESERAAWVSLPFFGSDGLPETGQQYLKRGLLAATIANPAVAGIALDLYAKSRRDGTPVPERTVASPSSLPAIDALPPWNK